MAYFKDIFIDICVHQIEIYDFLVLCRTSRAFAKISYSRHIYYIYVSDLSVTTDSNCIAGLAMLRPY